MQPRHIIYAVLIFVAADIAFLVFKHHRAAAPSPAVRHGAIASYAADAQATRAWRAQATASFAPALDEAPTAGHLRLEGQVLAGDQQPVPGATVVLVGGAGRKVTTQDDGSFVVDQLAPRSYTLFALAAEGVAGPVVVRLTPDREPVILRLRPASRIGVRVVDGHSHAPVAGAQVELRGLLSRAGTTGVDGVARLTNIAPGDYQVVATADGYAKQFAYAHVTGGSAAQQVELALVRGAPLSGSVLGPDGQPVGGAVVTCDGASDWVRRSDPRRDGVTTDDAGRFTLDALPAGSFRLRAAHEPDAPGVSEVLTLDGKTPRTGVVVRLAEGVTVRGNVVDLHGAPVAAAQVQVIAGSAAARPRQTYTDESGRFELRGLPRRPLAFAAVHPTGASDVVRLTPAGGPVESVRLVLTRTLTISGRVVGPDGAPLEAAHVTVAPDLAGADVSPAEWRLGAVREQVADGSGRFEVDGLAAGRYTVRASATTVGPGREHLADPVHVAAGTHDLTLVVPRGGALKGQLVFKDGKRPPLFTLAISGRTPIPFSSGDGGFVIDDLPPSTYDLVIRGPGFAARYLAAVKIEAAATTDLGTLELDKGRTVSGRVSMNGSPVPGATVRVGPLLFGSGSANEASTSTSLGGESATSAQTDGNGEFTLFGLPASKLVLTAEAEAGRAQPLSLPVTNDSLSGIELVLQPCGALTGTVVKDGEGVAGVIVNARPMSSTGVFYGVTTGPDGRFRFDRLAPGSYKVSATTTSLSGMGMNAVAATITSGQTADVRIDLGGGDLTLAVALRAPDGAVPFATVALTSAAIAPHTADELLTAMAASDHGRSAMGLVLGGRPATLKQLQTGHYTVCAVPYPARITDLGSARTLAENGGGRLPVFCQPVTLAEAPSEQSMEIPVQIPPDPQAN